MFIWLFFIIMSYLLILASVAQKLNLLGNRTTFLSLMISNNFLPSVFMHIYKIGCTHSFIDWIWNSVVITTSAFFSENLETYVDKTREILYELVKEFGCTKFEENMEYLETKLIDITESQKRNDSFLISNPNSC